MTTLDFGDRTPVKVRPSTTHTTASVRKSASVMPRLVSRSRSFAADRGDPPPPSKIPRSPFPAEKCSMSCTASRTMSRRVREEEDTATSSKSTARVPVLAKLNALGKEAMEQREQAQKVEQEAMKVEQEAHKVTLEAQKVEDEAHKKTLKAQKDEDKVHKETLEAQKVTSARDNVSRIYKMFSELSKTARADAPAACFDGFLSFHQEAVQAVADIESIQAAATSDEPAAAMEAAPPNVLQEIAQNRTATPRRRGLLGFGGVSKSVSFASGTLLDPSSRQDGGRSSSASRKCLAADRTDDKRSSAPVGAAAVPWALGSSLRMAKQIQAEVGTWFMEFLEAVLETGQSGGGGGCPQPLMLRVIKWVEMEQSGGERGGSRKAGHPRAAAVARKLRIKAKKPWKW